MPDFFSGLLSLFPHRIDVAGPWLGVGDGCGWVEHNGAACSEHLRFSGGLTRCWVLRRHPVGVVLWSASWLGFLTRSVVGVVVLVGWGCGCVLSVA